MKLLLLRSKRLNNNPFDALFSSHTRKRSRRKTTATREPYVPVIHDDVIKSVRQARSRHDDIIYPSLLVDDCARAAGCRDCVCVSGDSLCDRQAGEDGTLAGDVSVRRQRQRRRPPTQLSYCAAGDCSCARRSSSSAQRKFTSATPRFPTPPPPPPPPPSTSRARTLETRAACRGGVTTTTPHDIILPATITTTSFDNDLLLQAPSTVDSRISCTPTGGASYETFDVTNQ